MSKSYKMKDNNYVDSTGVVHNKELLNDVLEKKFDKTGGTITGNVNINATLQTKVITSDKRSAALSPGQSVTINLSSLFGFFLIRLSASMFEIYRVYAFMGLNRYAQKADLLSQYAYNR